jgi:hypothetical protein
MQSLRMHLRQSLARFFHRSAISEGARLEQDDRVSITTGSARMVEAEVDDEGPLGVTLNRVGALVTSACECGRTQCGHVWATILATDREGLLLGVIGSAPPYMVPRSTQAAPPPPESSWRDALLRAAREAKLDAVAPAIHKKPELEIFYEINPGTVWRPGLGVSVRCRERRASGQWGVIKALQMKRSEAAALPEQDRQIVERLAGSRKAFDYDHDYMPADFLIGGPSTAEVLATLCATDRTFLPGPQMGSPVILSWDSGPAWTFDLVIKRGALNWQLSGRLKRGAESMTLLEPRFLSDSGILCVHDSLVRFDAGNSYSWIDTLRKEGSIQVPLNRGDDLVRELMGIRNCPPVEWPDELKFEEIRLPPQPRATFQEPKGVWSAINAPMRIELAFAYQDEVVIDDDPRKGFYLEQPRRLVSRDFDAEMAAMATLDGAGAKINKYGDRPRWEIPRKRVPSAVRDLVRAGWQVKLDGKTFRNAMSVKAEIRSGIDWFEVHGAIDYGEGASIPFPRLLAALERGEHHIQLGDGTLGVLPDDFLAQYAALLRLGKKDGDHIRFSRAQTSLLDALLFERGQVSADEVFLRARAGLRQFEGVNAASQPKHFTGELRHYQLEGLGWMEFLRTLGLGGCLADDMGVGKTPQVLALLENRRALRESLPLASPDRPRASLVVVPRSLIYNWKQEAARFTPKLRVLDHSMPDRATDEAVFDQHDMILTTYGLLRRDVVDFRDYEFDYAVLDEAQAIKNANSASAKAARLLKARHRLVMSGTPIENHLGELWSLFEFLNPGMLGAASVFQKGTASLKNPDAETRELLSKALRPLILRRTKAQVIKELPPKLEQTIYCEMDADQRKLYEEMRDHYRGSLLGRISKQGMAKSKMHILEALLRLRQAACHPGLIDKTRTGEVSAKLENLLPQLEEVMDGGHKAIVFSQFTSLLAIVREHLDKQNVIYEYLDGKTKDRQAAVERFQGDATCKLFLVSLKAGGLGLNLTAAEYVFLLDPWWNPAVESQAIDRAHRIGQTRSVFAYRLICRGTVEEKVLELQKSKRDLADAIIGEDNRLIGTLQREDLELLLS